MNRIHLFLLMLIIVASLQLTACGPEPTTIEQIDPSRLQDIEGSELKLVMLTEKAVERIGVETAPASGRVVPYSAVIYDVEGKTWVYTNPGTAHVPSGTCGH